MVYCWKLNFGGSPMEAVIKKLKNFWYYYKIPVGIGIAVLLVVLYLGLQSAGQPEADYHIGLVSVSPRSDTQLAALTDGFAAAGRDLNGDGQVLVQLHTYFVDLADDSPNAGVVNADKVAALDADLIGKVSGLFLTESPEVLNAVTNGLFEETYLPRKDGLYLCIRKDAPEAYRSLLDSSAP